MHELIRNLEMNLRLTLSKGQQLWLFHVDVSQRTTKKRDRHIQGLQGVQTLLLFEFSIQICDFLVTVSIVVAKAP